MSLFKIFSSAAKSVPSTHPPTMEERYLACMILGASGDALGYRQGLWEFERKTSVIQAQVKEIGLENLDVSRSEFMVSDDTVMHLATAAALVKAGNDTDRDKLCRLFAVEYKNCMKDMDGRAPGLSCIRNLATLKYEADDFLSHIPFHPTAGGCGAAMRSMCIGLRFWRPEEENLLVMASIESGRLSHNLPTGYLGSLASAALTAFAIRGAPITAWGRMLLKLVDDSLEYVKANNRNAEEAQRNWGYFGQKWRRLLEERRILEERKTNQNQVTAHFEDDFLNDPAARDAFYKTLSFDGIPGASGHDAPLIAYDALLGCGNNWEKLCEWAVFHGGDSDSTGSIAAAIFGAMYGFHKVPQKNYVNIEKETLMAQYAKGLFELARHDTTP